MQTASDGRIIRAACVAHARRKVFNARANHPTHAAVRLSMFQQLYDIEDRAKTGSAAERQDVRQAEAKPIWDRMREYINGAAERDGSRPEPGPLRRHAGGEGWLCCAHTIMRVR